MSSGNFLIILVGLPASGKSTFASALTKILDKKFIGFETKRIDPDIIREDITSGEFDPTQEPHVREKNLEAIKKALRKGDIVISDDLNYYSSMRHDLREIAQEANVRAFIIHVSTPLEICLQWNEKRGKPIPNSLIIKIEDKFDGFERYQWDAPFRVLNMAKIQDVEETAEHLVEDLIQELMTFTRPPPLQDPEKIKAQTEHEMLDQITRSIVSTYLRNPEYVPFKNQILTYRKDFVKKNLDTSLNEKEIREAFKSGLETQLNLKK